MAIRTVDTYKYRDFRNAKTTPHFEISEIRLNTHCIANEDELSEHFKIFWIENGSGKYQIDFKSVTIENSGIFCLSPGQVLRVENEQVKLGYQISFDKDFYCVETHGKEIACNGVLFNNVLRATVIPLESTDVPTFRPLIDSMIVELEKPGAAHQAMLETYLRLFLIQALRKLEEQQPELRPNDEEINHPAADFIALVEKNFRSIHSVAKYAEMLFISPKSLSKRLKALGYQTPTSIIHDRILLQAKRDLRFTDKTVKEIAFDLGFEDPAYFSRLFSRKEGVSPLAYRSDHV